MPKSNENIRNLIRDSNQKVPNLRVGGVLIQGRPKTVAHAKGKLEIELRLPTEDFTYGIPNRPSTPIKAVISKRGPHQTTATATVQNRKLSRPTPPEEDLWRRTQRSKANWS